MPAASGPGKRPPEEVRLGDYRLGEVLAEGVRTRTVRAEQVSMGRMVVLEQIREEFRHDPAVVEAFLDDVRAKAAVDHPGIGLVYEAVENAEAVYYTREELVGTSFEHLRAAGETFSAAAIATFLRQVGSAMEYLEESGLAKLPLTAADLVLGDHGVVRIANLAVAGREQIAAAGHDRAALADVAQALLQPGGPGATRAGDLLRLMGQEEGDALSWTQVVSSARKLEQDLSQGAMAASQAIRSGPRREGGSRSGRLYRTALVLLAGVPALAGLVAGGFYLSNRKSPPKPRDLEAMVEVPAGPYRTHDGRTADLPRFWLDAHEVTIAEYAAFLAALEALPPEKREAYDHPEQPGLKRDHIPDDWEAMWNTARSGSMMEGMPIDLNHPVTRVDWWDAWSYAAWSGARLPSQEEWLAAAQEGGVTPSEWGPVDQLPGDVTPRGIHGLAGNVSEWVRDEARNPAFPMHPKKPVCCGASWSDPRNGAEARTWQANRETRLRHVGFRTARDSPP